MVTSIHPRSAVEGTPIGSPLGRGRSTQGPSRLWTLVQPVEGRMTANIVPMFFTFFRSHRVRTNYASVGKGLPRQLCRLQKQATVP
jgi:hypothetical protein